MKHFTLHLFIAFVAVIVLVFWLNRNSFISDTGKISQLQDITPSIGLHHESLAAASSDPGENSPVISDEPGPSADEHHSSASPVVTSSLSWRMYTNEKYGFSIQYPCDASCEVSLPRPYPNTYLLTEIWLPTIHKKTKVLVWVFTDESVQTWNSALEGPDRPYPYALTELKRALNLPVGAECQIYWHDEPTKIVEEVKKCTVVVMVDQKALKLIVGAEGPNDTGAKTKYLMRIQKGGWLEVHELFYTYDSDVAFLLDNSKASSEQRDQITAAEEVVGTLTFTHL